MILTKNYFGEVIGLAVRGGFMGDSGKKLESNFTKKVICSKINNIFRESKNKQKP